MLLMEEVKGHGVKSVRSCGVDSVNSGLEEKKIKFVRSEERALIRI